MSNSLDVFDAFSRAYAREKFETMSLRDYLLAARDKDASLMRSYLDHLSRLRARLNGIGGQFFVDDDVDCVVESGESSSRQP